ncbi:MAG TPA: class I SAM-dependent methyltransferase [Alphaproteobacteria bacterium]|nr:class I SAM-dependent methyltransferase [Alphaproteobacteria bacterium]
MTDPTVRAQNRAAWDSYSHDGDIWTVPVEAEAVARARGGAPEVLLTETTPVPQDWLQPLAGRRVLCLAGAGGQQGPLLAAAGAIVTVFDNSPRQLAADAAVARREGLDLTLVEGDMTDLSAFADGSFDMVFHPCSNLFVPDVRPVWGEAHRVLRPGGELLSGFLNPVEYVFDRAVLDRSGEFVVRFGLPYDDRTALSEAERTELYGPAAPYEFGHTLDDQIGGQLAVGFTLVGFFEDRRRDGPMARIMPSYIATRARK